MHCKSYYLKLSIKNISPSPAQTPSFFSHRGQLRFLRDFSGYGVQRLIVFYLLIDIAGTWTFFWGRRNMCDFYTKNNRWSRISWCNHLSQIRWNVTNGVPVLTYELNQWGLIWSSDVLYAIDYKKYTKYIWYSD